MAGIERLVTDSEDRLVVIVSHLPALRERIEALIVLHRDAGTATIVKCGRDGVNHEGEIGTREWTWIRRGALQWPMKSS